MGSKEYLVGKTHKNLNRPVRVKGRALKKSSSGQYVVVAAEKSPSKTVVKKIKRDARAVKVDMRISSDVKATLQSAAAAADQTLSAFVTESALERARQILADRNQFVLNDAAWSAFTEALDAPVRPLPRVARLFKEKAFGE
jgi:uncharacterized protein (DUF1778 family)